MNALVRYAWSDTISAQRWVAPMFVFLGVDAIASATTGNVLPAYSAVAATLLFIATWCGLLFSNTEDPVQNAVTVATSGSETKVRLSKLVAAYEFSVALGMVGLIGPAIATSSPATASDIVTGGCEILVTALAGVALGALFSRPIVRRAAWAFLGAVGASLGLLIIPHCPPTAQFVSLFSKTHPTHVQVSMLIIAGETVAMATVFVLTSLRLARART
jgi:hypothetical protein